MADSSSLMKSHESQLKMADSSSLMKSHESQDEGGQAQAMRLDESVMMGKGCEPQDNMQQGIGQGDALKDAAAGGNDATKNSGPAAGDRGGNNSNSNTYLYTNHSLI